MWFLSVFSLMPRLEARSALVASAPVTGFVMSRESLPPAHAERSKATQRSARPWLPIIVVVSVEGDAEGACHRRRPEAFLHERPEDALPRSSVHLASFQAPLERALEQFRLALCSRLLVDRRPRRRRGDSLRLQAAGGKAGRSAPVEQRTCARAGYLAVVEISEFADARHGAFEVRAGVPALFQPAAKLRLGTAPRRQQLQRRIEDRTHPGAVRTARSGSRLPPAPRELPRASEKPRAWSRCGPAVRRLSPARPRSAGQERGPDAAPPGRAWRRPAGLPRASGRSCPRSSRSWR